MARIPSSTCSGRGGQPGIYTSTGIILSIPCKTEYVSKIPPLQAQAPMLNTHRGSAICSYTWRSTGAIFLAMVPITMSRSAWRGENDKRSAPKRAKSYVDDMVDMNSKPQKDVAKG